MKKEAFQTLKDIEGTWWHVGRLAAVRAAVTHTKRAQADKQVLDVGAGYGGMFPYLSSFGTVDAVERDDEAREECARLGYRKTLSDISDVANESYDVISAFDVIEHIENDATFVAALSARLKKGGVLLATVPAFQFLWSKHDVLHEHYRRYNLSNIKTLLEANGFEVSYVRYWNVALFIPALIMRLMNRTGESALGLPRWIDKALQILLRLESQISRVIPFPFGTGIVIVARTQYE